MDKRLENLKTLLTIQQGFYGKNLTRVSSLLTSVPNAADICTWGEQP
jgi:hypothetical protein